MEMQGLKVLVVDDNATNRRILNDTITRWGMKPTCVDRGWLVVSELRRAAQAGEPYALTLLDACMPEMDGFAVAQLIRASSELEQMTVIMLTSSGIHGEAARCRELGVAAYLTKPISQSDLFDAIAQVLTTTSSTAAAAAKVVIRQTLRESNRSLHILLAEDNTVNQMLAVRLLEKRGHTVEVAANGKLALSALEAGRFDAILMDVQMPEMSGFEATTAIREKEQSTGGRIPIIAMTAHAMKGDRERCIAEGMDGYVSKPIRAKELFEAIDDLVPPSNPPAAMTTDYNPIDR
jgi:CheY-like chemotaxis protein